MHWFLIGYLFKEREAGHVLGLISFQDLYTVSERVSEWVSEWVSERVSEWVSEWVSGRASEWVSEWVSEGVGERVSEWVSEWVRVCVWVRVWVRVCVSESVCVWVSDIAAVPLSWMSTGRIKAPIELNSLASTVLDSQELTFSLLKWKHIF